MSPPEQTSEASGRPRAASREDERNCWLGLERLRRHFRLPPMPDAAAAASSSSSPSPPPPDPSRRRRRRPPPNPLFTRWLREWRDEAAGSKLRGVYERALRSLSRYPLPLRSGEAAAVLRHFGPGICRRLTLRLRQHRSEQGLPPSPPPEGRGPEPPLAPPTRRSSRDYRPLPRSRAHALLVTLHRSPSPLLEAELLLQARPLCDRPLPPAALGPLLRRDLLQRSGCPPRYSLTPGGRILAQRLADAAPFAPPPASGGAEGGGEETPPPPSPPSEPEFELKPGEFDILLCADVTEANGPGGGAVPRFLQGPPPLLRRLQVGDFLWVARERDPPTGRRPRELVLDVVVERKTAADLGKSLMDGRYREQKFRLGRCGLRHPVYLLEGPWGGEQLPLPLPVLRQAAASTQVVDGFFVKRTGGPRESAAFLGALGEQLRRRFGGRVLRSWGGDVTGRGPPEPPGAPCALLPFPRLRERGGKIQPQTVGAVFGRQLLQVGGLGGGGAKALLSRFPTPASLMAAYSSLPLPHQREALLRDIKWGPRQRNLGPSLSRALAQLYGSEGPLT